MCLACVVYGVRNTRVVRVGGLTWLGKVEGGRYYLGSHGDLTEVTWQEWEQARRDERFEWILWWVMWANMGIFALTLRERSPQNPPTQRTAAASSGAVE